MPVHSDGDVVEVQVLTDGATPRRNAESSSSDFTHKKADFLFGFGPVADVQPRPEKLEGAITVSLRPTYDLYTTMQSLLNPSTRHTISLSTFSAIGAHSLYLAHLVCIHLVLPLRKNPMKYPVVMIYGSDA
jgi:hypothetical protein